MNVKLLECTLTFVVNVLAKNKAADFKPEHWEVIRLFTSDVGETVTKQQWLELAKTQLAKMTESK